jgi:branched-chain amino acid transport system ATP-binding protein
MLEVERLSARYGSIYALKEVSLAVRAGEIVTVVGPNGAGKTTLLRTLSGLHRASSGSVRLLDREITYLDAHHIVRAGVTQVLQGRQIFEDMTVLQNLRMGAYCRSRFGADDLGPDLDEVYSYFPILHERRRQKGGTLSGGEQVMLAIGRALMARPMLLLLDEPSLGLAPKVVDTVFEALQRLNRAGRTIVLVEQNAELAFDLAVRGYLMVLGQVALEGPTRELRTSQRVVDLYLGQSGRVAD